MKIIKKSAILKRAEGFALGLAQKSRERRETLRALTEITSQPLPLRNDLVPTLRMEIRHIDRLQEQKRQLRKVTAEHQAEIMDSIRHFGVCRPVAVTEDGEIVDGHAIVHACRELGVSEIPCLIITHLARADRRRLRIALNRIQEKGLWNIEELQAEFAELKIELGPDFHVPGVEFAEKDMILQEVLQNANNPLDHIPIMPSRPVSQLGDIWELGKHVLACGDARDKELIAIILDGRLVRLILSDPPYNVRVRGHITGGDHREFPMASGEMSDAEFAIFLLFCLECMWDALTDGGLALIFMDWRGLRTLLNAADKVGFHLLNLIVWAKTNAGMGSLYRSQHELLTLLKKGLAAHINNIELGRHGRWRSNLWTYPGANTLTSEARESLANHPTPKPIALLEDALLDVTNPADLIFDGFTGSGSTLVAVEQTGRVFCGIELDRGYVDLTLMRWAKMTNKTPRLRETGESFAKVKVRREREAEPSKPPSQAEHSPEHHATETVDSLRTTGLKQEGGAS